MSAAPPAAPVVIKVGGGLLGVEGALGEVAGAMARHAVRHRLVVVPGGGPLADAVRRLDADAGLSDDAAHWMAILAMDQYGHLLAERIAGGVLVEEPGGVAEAHAAGRIPVLAPYRWMRAADVLPHRWDATSDSVAAFVAGALDARLLVLVKPVEGPRDAQVDGCFPQVVPAGLPWRTVSWRGLRDLPELD